MALMPMFCGRDAILDTFVGVVGVVSFDMEGLTGENASTQAARQKLDLM